MSLFDTGVRPAIDEYLAKKGAEVRDYGDYWSASSAGYCMRKNLFERLGVPHVEKDSDNRTTRVFEAGHIFHSWIQGITKDAGLSIASEVELIDDDFMIKGHFDDLVLIKSYVDDANEPATTGTDKAYKQENLILYDYKTAHSKWFEYVKDRPMSHYNKMQLGTYMYMLRSTRLTMPVPTTRKTEYGTKTERVPQLLPTKDLTEARILKISKDDLRLHEIQLLWSDDLEAEIKAYWTVLNEHWKKKTLPPCTCGDYEVNKKTGVGFMADPKYNPYFYQGEPCSIAWYSKWKAENEQTQDK